jgi:hypothetical protein
VPSIVKKKDHFLKSRSGFGMIAQHIAHYGVGAFGCRPRPFYFYTRIAGNWYAVCHGSVIFLRQARVCKILQETMVYRLEKESKSFPHD